MTKITHWLIIASITSLCIVRGASTQPFDPAPAARFPDILFTTSSGGGGYGRLVYSISDRRYFLLDGRIRTYAVDDKRVRLRRADERGGISDNPATIVTANGKFFSTSHYQKINQLDPVTGELIADYPYGDFAFRSHHVSLHAAGSTLFLVDGQRLISLDLALVKLDEKKMTGRVPSTLIQDGNKLYGIEVDNPNMYTDCFGGCHLPTVIRQTTVDFSTPSDITMTRHEEPVQHQDFFRQQAIYKGRGWILAKHEWKQPRVTLEFHPFDALATASASLVLPDGADLLAMTGTSPVWLILKTGVSDYQLGSLTLQSKRLRLETTSLEWVKDSYPTFQLQSNADGAMLFISSGHQLAVYEVAKLKPALLLQQDFRGRDSGSFQLDKLTLAVLPATVVPLDRQRLEAALSKNYWDEQDRLSIAAEITKLTPSDTWAIPLCVDLLKNTRKPYGSEMIFMKALEKFGPAASSALPVLLSQNIGSVHPTQRSLAFPAIKKIDPTGAITIRLTKAYLEDSFKVANTVELLEFIASPQALALARATRSRWKGLSTRKD